MSSPVPFQFTGRPLLSRSVADRREALRDDGERHALAWAKDLVLLMDQADQVPTLAHGTELHYQPAVELAEKPPADAVFLGEYQDVGYWAMRVSSPVDSNGVTLPQVSIGDFTLAIDERWMNLRALGAVLGDADAGLLTTATALLNWHRDARFCAVCGHRTEAVRAGWAMRCMGCGREEYPRTDPAIICLVHDGVGVNGEHILLARQPGWKPNHYSVLAGFVEAGESLEDCVVREVSEEVGLDVHGVRYLGNQPWPFPRSLMLAFTAIADRSAPIYPAKGEIEAARWCSRSEIQAAIAAGGTLNDLTLPVSISVASQMIHAWSVAT